MKRVFPVTETLGRDEPGPTTWWWMWADFDANNEVRRERYLYGPFGNEAAAQTDAARHS